MTDTQTLERMVQYVEPTWRVEDATAATEGAHLVHFLDVATDEGHRECVLKATPPDVAGTCDSEARLLAVLSAHTSLPVPEVFCAVDDHGEFPAPFLLESTLPGTYHSREELPDLRREFVAAIARSTGRHLAALHEFDAVETYGFLTAESGRELDGERPSADPAQLTVHDPVDSWPAYLDREVDRVANGLPDTRFADLTDRVRETLETRVDRVAGAFHPVVARIDHSLDNVLVDPATGDLTGLLDWEFCVAATPGYDLAFVEHTLAGGHWQLFHDADYRETVREGLCAGYAERGPPEVVPQFRENRACYDALVSAHALLNFDDWFDQVDVAADRRETAARRLRAEADRAF